MYCKYMYIPMSHVWMWCVSYVIADSVKVMKWESGRNLHDRTPYKIIRPNITDLITQNWSRSNDDEIQDVRRLEQSRTIYNTSTYYCTYWKNTSVLKCLKSEISQMTVKSFWMAKSYVLDLCHLQKSNNHEF